MARSVNRKGQVERRRQEDGSPRATLETVETLIVLRAFDASGLLSIVSGKGAASTSPPMDKPPPNPSFFLDIHLRKAQAYGQGAFTDNLGLGRACESDPGPPVRHVPLRLRALLSVRLGAYREGQIEP
jgi:hypothetical protein